MKNQKNYHSAIIAALLALVFVSTPAIASTDTTFNFQGRFDFEGEAAEGDFEFELTLFNTEVEGAQVGPTLNFDEVPVSGGLFSLPLNFGDVFTGEPRWLRIRLRPAGSEGAWVNLSPRQRLQPVPAAHFATVAGSLADANPTFSGSLTATSFIGNGGSLTGIHTLGSPDGTVAQALRVFNDGRIGIGTATPAAELDVIGTVRASGIETVGAVTAGSLAVEGGIMAQGAVAAASFVGDGSALTGIRLHALSSPDGLLSDAVSVNNSGNLGVGIAEPAARLHVKHPTNSEQAWPVIVQNQDQASFLSGMRVSDGGFFEVSNNILAATPAFARLNSSGTWTAVSDRRMKTDIKPLHGALDGALALEPVSFRPLASAEDPNTPKQIGFIAQQVAEVYPSLVVEDEILSLDYATLSTVAIAAIQEQQKIIEALTASNAALLQRIEKLEAGGKITDP